MYTVTAPFQIYAQRLDNGKVLLTFYSQSYIWHWLAFALIAAGLYYVVARSLFASAMNHGLKVGFSAVAAQVAGLFGVVVAFYVVFFFFNQERRVEAWCMELTLLLFWFMFFLFSYFTAPESR